MLDLIRRLAEAASVLRRLPEGSRYDHPYLTIWPNYQTDPSTAYGYMDVKVSLPIPSPATIVGLFHDTGLTDPINLRLDLPDKDFNLPPFFFGHKSNLA